MKKTSIILAAVLAFAACQKNDNYVPAPDGAVLTATIEEGAVTKIYMDADNNIRWSEGDQIIAFMKSSYGHKYQLKSDFAGKVYADFVLVPESGGGLSAGIEWNHNVVYYPYSSSVEAEKSASNYVLSVNLPSEQTYARGSFGNASMAMVALSEDNNITFRNVLGGIKLQFKGTHKVASIRLEGKNSEILSGPAIVTAYTDETKPTIVMTDDASTSVTLNCGSKGVQLDEINATEFIIALPPIIFSKGFTIMVTDTDGKIYTVDTDKANNVLRSSILVMPEIVLPSQYVDEYGVNHGPGIKIGETVWAPVNCGYHEVDFKYGKLYQWGRKYGQGYDGPLYVDGSKVGVYSDATVPVFEEGGVSPDAGNLESNSNVFYLSTSSITDWASPMDNQLWNSGTESSPIKTGYDPCPKGWRVPTDAEWKKLYKNHSSFTTNDSGQSGYWLSGELAYSSEIPQVFIPAAGGRYHTDGVSYNRGQCAYYWSSRSLDSTVMRFYFSDSNIGTNADASAYGHSVRCVQE